MSAGLEAYGHDVKIANGANSVDIILGDQRIADGTLQLPAAFTGTNLTVQMSIDGTTFTTVAALTEENNPITFAANETHPIPKRALGAPYIRLLSQATELAERTIKVHFRKRA